MLKPFNDLIKLDIKDYIEKKPNFVWDKKEGKYKEKGSFDYLNWAKAIMLLYEHGAEEVNYRPLKNEAGHSLFMNPSLLADGLDGCPEVRVWVKVDDREGEFSYPLARGASIVKKDKMTALDVHVCQQRALVKGIAILTGLGLNLWAKEDLSKENIEDGEASIDKTKIQAIEMLAKRKGVPIKQILNKCRIDSLDEMKLEQFVTSQELLMKMEDRKQKDLGL